MKIQFLYIVILLAFISCTDNVKFNSPAFEAQKNNVFWRAIDARASLSSTGSWTINAFTSFEKVILKTASTTAQTYPQTYTLGTSDTNTASYTSTNTSSSITYSTGIDIGNGQIIITEYDIVNKTVSGTFKFNAENTIGTSSTTLNFQYGTFYKVPVTVSSTAKLKL